MTGVARAIVLGISAALVLGGIAIQASVGAGWGLMALGGLIGASVLLEGRYRGRSHGAPDRRHWQRTGERELDSETGRIVEVWFDPSTGERHYLPLSDS